MSFLSPNLQIQLFSRNFANTLFLSPKFAVGYFAMHERLPTSANLPLAYIVFIILFHKKFKGTINIKPNLLMVHPNQ